MSHERSSGDHYYGIPELFRYCLKNSGKEIKFIRQTMEKERSKKGENESDYRYTGSESR